MAFDRTNSAHLATLKSEVNTYPIWMGIMKTVIVLLLALLSWTVNAASIIDITIESAGDERRKITYTVTLEDNLGAQSIHKHGPVIADASYDAVAAAPEVANRLLSGFAESEDLVAEGQAIEGGSLNRALNPRWSTSKRIAKRLIRLMMRERDPRLVIALEPFIQYLKANYTTAQMANFLDISTDQVLRMNRRVNAILQDAGTVKAQMLVFDAEQEEIND